MLQSINEYEEIESYRCSWIIKVIYMSIGNGQRVSQCEGFKGYRVLYF